MKLLALLLVCAFVVCAQGQAPPLTCTGPGVFGLASGGCSPTFYQCAGAGDVAQPQSCAAGLSFDATISVCQLTDLVAACNPAGVCKKAGLFRVGRCRREFYNCGGPGQMRIRQPCPTGLVFSGKTKTCEERANVIGCNLKKP